MKGLSKTLLYVFMYLSSGIGVVSAFNQTAEVSPILPEAGLPFSISIEEAPFQLPAGIHSGAFGVYKGLWVLIAGTHLGLHGFGPDPFPAEAQNTQVYVVNPVTGSVSSRSLKDPSSGLTQQQIDTLSVISPQFYQLSDTLYLSGGYGIDTTSNTLGTKPVFTAINLQGLVQWVTQPGTSDLSVNANIRQIYDPVFQISGGEMYPSGDIVQLVFGQNFTGAYTDSSNGVYSEQIRRFKISDTGGQLGVTVYGSLPSIPDPNYRRRDLNILPVLLNNNNKLEYGLVAYSGVFTPAPDNGIWTVPVVINQQGVPSMADPNAGSTFKQGMSNYVCAAASLYSKKYMSSYNIFFGGISYGFYSGGVFQTDSEIPFINQVTTIKMDKQNQFTQYLMNSEYPVILATTAPNLGAPLLFGAGAYFIPNNILQYPNKVISLDTIRRSTIIGYIVGGIQSTAPNTSSREDSSASPHIFKVTLVPRSSIL